MANNPLTAIIVDDEINARENLQILIDSFCESVKIVGEAKHVDEAIILIENQKPQLVFLDIEMPQKNGFELLYYFKEIPFHVVFVTAYDSYAIKAFEVSAVDYLLKPIEIDRLKAAIKKVVAQEEQLHLASRYHSLKENIESQDIKTIYVPYKSDYAIIDVATILYIQANRMYSNICVFDPKTQQQKVYVYAKKLSYFEELFKNNPSFARTHRSWMVNTKHIQSYSKKNQLVTLIEDIEIPVSKSGKNALEILLGF